MSRSTYSIVRMVRAGLVALGFIFLDLYGIKPPPDIASLTCLSVGQLAAVGAAFIPDMQRVEIHEPIEAAENSES